MHHAELTELVRGLVAEEFRRLRLADGQSLRESLLIRNGHYCGRRFEVEGGHALWFFEEDQIKLFGPEGRVVRVLHSVSAKEPALRMAA